MRWICNRPWQQCSEFALHWLMWSCGGDLNCRAHAHLQCLFSWSTSSPERMAPSSPGLHPCWYPTGDAHTYTQHMNQLEEAPSAAAAVSGQKTPNLVVLIKELLSLTDLTKMHFNTSRLLDVQLSLHILLWDSFSQKCGASFPACTSVWHPQTVNMEVH